MSYVSYNPYGENDCIKENRDILHTAEGDVIFQYRKSP
ncbi:hypothetical protein F3D3_3890 [Fusibacter sp. 3D3]|nr:hypothetical protein F3D3_3890 [Fusibacter sp. 3D3]